MLEYAQALYETHKLISYPRTESRHISEDKVPELPGILGEAGSPAGSHGVGTAARRAPVGQGVRGPHQADRPPCHPAHREKAVTGSYPGAAQDLRLGGVPLRGGLPARPGGGGDGGDARYRRLPPSPPRVRWC